MTFQRLAAAMAAALLAVPTGASALQGMIAPAGPAAQPAAAADSPCCTVPARTPIEIEMIDTVNSKTNHQGENFAFRLAAPLTIDGHVLIPAGTRGVGEVVHAARARAMGKGSELILAARYLDLGGTRIALRTLRFGPQQGHDSSQTLAAINVAAAATVPALGLVAFVIAGGEVNVPAGTHGSAQIAAEITLAPIE